METRTLKNTVCAVSVAYTPTRILDVSIAISIRWKLVERSPIGLGVDRLA